MDNLNLKIRAISGDLLRNEKLYFFEKLTDQRLKAKAKINVNVRIVESEDFPKIAKRFENLLETEAINRSKMGHICFGAELNGEFVHSTWVSFNNAYVGPLERKLRVSSDSAYIYDIFTVPEYRGLQIAPKVFSDVLNYLRDIRKIKKIYVSISHTNYSSLRVAKKEGLRKIGAIKYVRICRWRLYRFQGETKEDHNKLKQMLL